MLRVDSTWYPLVPGDMVQLRFSTGTQEFWILIGTRTRDQTCLLLHFGSYKLLWAMQYELELLPIR